MQKAKETTIRGRTFKVTQLPGMRGCILAYSIVGTCFPALMKVGDGFAALRDATLDGDSAPLLLGLGNAIAALYERLPPQEMEKLLRELLATATVKPLEGGNEQLLLPIFDQEMAGEVGTVFELLGFALKVNYENFSPGLAAKARAVLGAKGGSASKESATSKDGLAGG